MSKFVLPVLLVAAVGALLLFHFGRPLWHPFALKLTGRETVADVVERLKANGVGIDSRLRESLDGIVLLALKEERVLEVWGKREGAAPTRIRTYPFTAYSGTLGPKLREGDGQIPEGVYRLEYLNPNSRFHLSMKLDYPNAFDREKGRLDDREKLGFDIFIHGRDTTIGCIPIGDEAIEELFLLVAEIGMENVAVIVAPYDMRMKQKEIAVKEISWEGELYDTIRAAIAREFPKA